MAQKTFSTGSLAFVCGCVLFGWGLWSMNAETITTLRGEIAAGAVATPLDLWRVPGTPELSAACVAVLGGGVVACASSPATLPVLLFFPLGMVNRLLRPVREGGTRGWSRGRACLLVGTLLIGLAGCEALVRQTRTESWLGRRLTTSLDSPWSVRWDAWLDRYWEAVGMALVGVSWGGVTVIAPTLLPRRRQRPAEGSLEDSPNWTESQVGGAAVRRAPRSRFSGTRMPSRLRSYQRGWLKQLRSLGFDFHGFWEFVAADGRHGFTATLIGCDAMVVVELTLVGRLRRWTLTSQLDDGTLVRTVDRRDPRDTGSTGSERMVCTSATKLPPKAVLANHLSVVAEQAEMERARIERLDGDNLHRVLSHGGFSVTPAQRSRARKYVPPKATVAPAAG